jgi:hypothetical protein
MLDDEVKGFVNALLDVKEADVEDFVRKAAVVMEEVAAEHPSRIGNVVFVNGFSLKDANKGHVSRGVLMVVLEKSLTDCADWTEPILRLINVMREHLMVPSMFAVAVDAWIKTYKRNKGDAPLDVDKLKSPKDLPVEERQEAVLISASPHDRKKARLCMVPYTRDGGTITLQDPEVVPADGATSEAAQLGSALWDAYLEVEQALKRIQDN